MYWSGLSAAANAAAAYQTGQTGYAVSHTPAAGTYTTQRAPSTYDGSYQTATSHASASYPTPSTTYDYGYTAARPPNQPAAAAAAAAAAVYDTSKTYYGQPAAAVAAAAATATPYTAAETHYQSGTLRQTSSTATTPKTSYATGYSVSSASQTPYNTTSYTAQSSSAANKGTGLYMQQSVQSANSSNVKAPGNTWQTLKKSGPFSSSNRGQKKPPPRPQQLHYCDVCKISCAGPQTYREHLEGQKHKKKEASAKAGPTPSRVGASLRCELCDVTCTGADAYAAHIRGAKHQKVVKLHQKLGKPIPSDDPVVVGAKSSTGAASSSGATASSTSAGAKTTATSAVTNSSAAVKKEAGVAAAVTSDPKDDLLELKEKEVEPVGQEYIEEIKGTEGDSQGKIISFNCKLCECRFNDPNAKEMHMKGRRHRLQYKKKVNPDLQVEVKPSMRQRKQHEERVRRQQLREDVWRRREEERLLEEEERWFWEEQRHRYELENYEYNMDMYRRYPRPGPPPPHPAMGPLPPHAMGPPGMVPLRPPFMAQMPPMIIRRPESSDDRHVVAKHNDIYPLENELAAIQKIVSNTEKALKLVSDYLADLDTPKGMKVKDDKKESKEKKEVPVAAAAAATATATAASAAPQKERSTSGSFSDKKDDSPARMLKGVMRVGILAKGLLLRGDVRVELVVLCGEKPTRTLLDRVADALPTQLTVVAPDEQYEVQRVVEEAALQVVHDSHTVIVTLTAPIMREQMLQQDSAESQVAAGVKDAPDVLDKQKCLDALAALRHAKWFQARANGLQSCVMVIRIMRDLCQRLPTWSVISSWALELICEKVIASAGQPMSPGDGLRRVFESISSGLLLPGSPGLFDPCEKDPLDASDLTAQEREEITASAQHALRLISFRQIHKVLGMDALPAPKFQRGRFTRKRRRDNSTGEGGDSEAEQDGADGKKDKKEDGGDSTMETDKAK